MAKYYLVLLLVRLLLPTGLLLSIALRPFGLSIIYLLLYLISPLVQVPNSRTFNGIRGKIHLLNLIVSIILLVCHAVWHTGLAIYGPYGSVLNDYPLVKTIGLNLGLVAYDKIQPHNAIHYISPELVMSGTSLIVYVTVKKLLSTPGDHSIEKPDSKHQRYPMLTNAGKYMCLFLLMFSGVMRPSVTSGVYFLVFMGAATAWALGSALQRGFAVLARCLMVYMAAHVAALVLYQWTYLNDLFPPDMDWARYFGLVRLVTLEGTEDSVFKYVQHNNHWTVVFSPLVILITYFVLALESRELLKPKPVVKASSGLESGRSNGSLVRALSRRHIARDKWLNAKGRVTYEYIDTKEYRRQLAEDAPLIRQRSSSRWSSGRSASATSRALRQDSTGSVLMPDEESTMDLEQPTLLDDIIEAVVDFFRVLVRSSYIATCIIMMAWSIMFHSWLTFVFLMWANLVWLCHNQRSFMLKTSPLLVIYAMFLLVVQYIYGMDLKESELPSNITEVNLQQLGVGRMADEAWVPLLIKSLFTCMFWVTLRQYVQDLRQKRRSSSAPAGQDLSRSALDLAPDEQRSRLLVSLGEWMRAFCARYWIYVVVILLFVIGITGKRMTIFRILYMFLFLVFILMFQISWYWWRRLMYGFWIVVIMYSMTNLILIYVYQFDNFSKMIETYLYINERLQNDLGLEPYHPADLFIKLLTPTCFLITTIMQVHYFHKDFMALSDPRSRSNSFILGGSSRPSQIASTMKDDLPPLPAEQQSARSETEAEHSLASGHSHTALPSEHLDLSRKHSTLAKSPSFGATVTERPSLGFRECLMQCFAKLKLVVFKVVDKLFLFLDLHINKITLVALMLLCVLNVCALHVPIMLMISPACLMTGRKQRGILLVISILISIYLMANMVYQIEYIEHSTFDVNCTVKVNSSGGERTETYNNAEWAGFRKSLSLASLLRGYIALIALFTFASLVNYRQANVRKSLSQIKMKENLMFPDVTREDADKDLVHCIKYLFNYGFYKFGVEITLICLIGVIGSRMDLYAVFYSIWLLILVSVNRVKKSKIWTTFTIFSMISIPIQYLLAVGVLPQFCVEYPWSGDSDQMKATRNWLFLPFANPGPHASKLIFDYFLLLFSARQLRVFHIERAFKDKYPGGSNTEDTGENWETLEFVNPVPDFMGCVMTWLDVVKRLVFLGMLWVTLAIMFLTGTNRVNLFSMGYLIGSFVFLWQGTDLYLRPKDSILNWWSWLLGYNVVVVCVKAALQVPGCLFEPLLQQHACWLVQLLGVGCVDKFVGGTVSSFLKMQHDMRGSKCSVPKEDIGLAWDGVCFAFLILQRRLFHSYYFYRVIDESKATTILASRGAELIEELRQKQMVIQDEQERSILEKIKIKMERIKANQKKIQGELTKEPTSHDRGDDSGSTIRHRPVFTNRHKGGPSYKPPVSHAQAVRSGDYYMFDEFDDTDVHIKDEESSSDEEAPKEMGFGKLLSTVIRTDLNTAVTLRRASSLRRASAPAVRSRRASLFSGALSYPHDLLRRRLSRPTSETKEKDVNIIMAERERDEPLSEIDPVSGPQGELTKMEKLLRIWETAWAFISSILVSVTRRLMKFSRDYRYISRTLSAEKRMLKETEGFGIGIREGSHQVWEPDPEKNGQNSDGGSKDRAVYPDRQLLMPPVEMGRKLSDISVPEIRILAPSMERGLDASPPRTPSPTPPRTPSPPPDDGSSEHESMFTLESTSSKMSTLDQEDSMFHQDKSPFVHLIYALWYAVLAHTDIVCYIMVFINQIQSATILSIPLPLMVFLWGTLTIPRPTKTFWVTLIAYTEVIVLIKSMFQFEILPWNQKVTPANMPFTAPRIIGIERKSNYALYDLLLLLIIFFHRFMLKSLGLWKESGPEAEAHVDAQYSLGAGEARVLAAGGAELLGQKYVQLHEHTTASSAADAESSAAAAEAAAAAAAVTAAEAAAAAAEQPREEEPGPSKTNDEDHYKVNDDQEPIIAVTTTVEDIRDHYPKVLCLSMKRYLRPVKRFFRRMVSPAARVNTDVYAYMFLCDFLNFLVVIFGFAAFGTQQGDGGVQAYLEDNKVPIPFLVMLILQFALIVIDRALYLRKYMLGKILFQYALIVGVHVWMFFVLPFITERTFNALLPPPMWYMVKCVYLLLSAHQLRCGYPRRIIGNFLCKSYRFLNMILFRCFMLVPFVFELRTLMDWIWTDTSMTLMDWLKMEDIFASVFLLKCSRNMEDKFPLARGTKKSASSKYMLGGSVLAFVIAIIWFPLVFFALGNTVGQPNPPTDVTVKIRIGPYLPVYQMTAQSHNIEKFTEQEYLELSNMYARDRTAQTFLSNYMYNDVAAIFISDNSTMTWDISPPELRRLEEEAVSNSTLVIKFTYVVTHVTNNAQNAPTIETSREVELEPHVTLPNGTVVRNPERVILKKMLDGSAKDTDWILINNLFPKFVRVFNKGVVRAATQLIPEASEEEESSAYRAVQVRLEGGGGGSHARYWRVRELCRPDRDQDLMTLPLNDCSMLVMYTFNDKLFPETLNFISGGGIIGLYTTFVFLASRVLRGFFSGIYTKIMFDDLPYADRVLQLCLDIYLVREALELTLEEDLFAKLVFLYRSPETMIKWTRPKEEYQQQQALPPPSR